MRSRFQPAHVAVPEAESVIHSGVELYDLARLGIVVVTKKKQLDASGALRKQGEVHSVWLDRRTERVRPSGLHGENWIRDSATKRNRRHLLREHRHARPPNVWRMLPARLNPAPCVLSVCCFCGNHVDDFARE